MCVLPVSTVSQGRACMACACNSRRSGGKPLLLSNAAAWRGVFHACIARMRIVPCLRLLSCPVFPCILHQLQRNGVRDERYERPTAHAFSGNAAMLCSLCRSFLITRKSGERSAFSAHHAKYFHYGLLQMGSLSYGLSEWPGGGDILLWARCSR